MVPLAAVVFWAYTRKNDPPNLPFARVKRDTLVSTLPTNGKVEPLQFASVHVNMAGMVAELPAKEGRQVAKGAELARISVPDLDAQLAAAQARVEQAKAELDNIERGGRKVNLVEIESSIERAKLDRDAALRDFNALERLEKKQAATHEEVELARAKVQQANLTIESLELRRGAQIGSSDHAVAEARFREAEAEAQLARRRIADTVVRSPLAGVVYKLPIRAGAYLNAGDLVASVGVLDRLRVRVYVDEPELGRVAIGLPVTITWEASRGRRWQGVVEQLPTQIQPLGTRQVGEVLCTIDNPGQELVPGTNVDVEIRSSVVQNTLTIPKEVLRRDANGTGVFVLSGDSLHWRAIKTGASSVNRVQVVEGLAEGDAVALPTDLALREGEKVMPVYR
jgi:HlyD family secretion protein